MSGARTVETDDAGEPPCMLGEACMYGWLMTDGERGIDEPLR